MKKNNTTIMRHILEIRLKNRIFSFIDFKGDFIDYLIRETRYENVNIKGNRIDVASKDLSEAIFFSWDNFGFQVDAVDDFKSFNEKVTKLFSLLSSYTKYSFEYVVRVGTKSSILNHQKGLGLDSLKQKYKELFFKNNQKLESYIGFNLMDLGYSFQDLEKNGNKLNLLTGPVTKDETIARFFDNKKDLYERFEKDNGIYLDIDYFQLKEQKISHLNTLKQQIETNISAIENVFNGVMKYIEDKP